MKKQLPILIGLGIINLLIIITVFVLLQNEQIYKQTMARFSQNYERVGDWNNYEIKKVTKPFLEINNENILQWDASIYKCISDRMYQTEDDCYGNVRSVFFPLFPLLWKWTNSSPIGISLINYLLFVLSISILLIHLLQTSISEKLIVYSVLLTLPSAIFFYIPYTEALFLLTMTIAAIGLVKDKYWLIFLALLLMAMVRPATIFVLFAFFATELLICIEKRNIRQLLKRMVFLTIPFFLGYFFSLVIQYIYTNSWTSFIDAQSHWAGGLQAITQITDWSVEGFGMSLFAVVFIMLPALAFVFFSILRIVKNKEGLLNKISLDKHTYLLFTAVFYLLGIFFFTLFTSGGNLHSFSRFTLASPFFYIALIIALNNLNRFSAIKTIMLLSFLTVVMIAALNLIEYGGERLQFSFMGMYLLIFSFGYLGLRRLFQKQLDYAILSLLLMLNIIWITFLYNVYLSDGWIFT
jgi:hypothetical protein